MLTSTHGERATDNAVASSETSKTHHKSHVKRQWLLCFSAIAERLLLLNTHDLGRWLPHDMQRQVRLCHLSGHGLSTIDDLTAAQLRDERF